MDTKTAGRRKKLEPDPRVRLEILSAASKIVREDGVRALSIAEVLGRAQLSTRGF
jgi:AcrR family transcriptional regulator